MLMQASQDFAATPAEWAVLTCSNAVTLRLADTLNEAGYEAWAPRTQGTKSEQKPHSIMPGFVFVPMGHIWLLSQMTYSPAQQFQVWDEEKRRMVARACPPFNVMRHERNREPVRIPDWQLNALRTVERRRKPRGIVKPVPVGATVRLMDGGFAGLDGIVQSVKNKFAMVSFAGFPVPVQIGCWLLTEKS